MNVIAPSLNEYSKALGYTGCMVSLDGSEPSTLKWELPEELPLVLWDLHLGLESLTRPLTDPLLFNSLAIAVQTFSDRVCDRNSMGVVLYKGNIDLSYRYPWDEESKELFQNWKQERYPQLEFSAAFEAHLKRVFCLTLLSEFSLRLASFLPEDMDPYLLLDVSGLGTPAYQAHLLSIERFSYLKLGLRGARNATSCLNWEVGKAYSGYVGRLPIPELLQPEINVGICLPEDRFCTPDLLSQIDRIINTCEEKGLTPKIVPEALLTESWDGLNDLIIIETALGPQGKRKLLGFCAAGGRVICQKTLIGLPGEILFESLAY